MLRSRLNPFSQQNQRHTRLFTAPLLTLLVSSALLSGCSEGGKTAAAPPPAAKVGVVTLQPQTVTLSRELPGRVQATQIAQIRPQVSGIVLSRQFTEGGQVQAGDTLYQIDPAPFEAALQSAKAAKARANANVASASAKASRYRELLKSKAVSQQEYDEAQAAALSAQADLLTAQAQINTAQINLNYSKVSSPISGQIGKSTVTSGALVTSGQAEVLATVTSLDPIYVDMTQSSSELLALKQALSNGQLGKAATAAQVSLQLEDGSRYPHQGTLQFAEVTVNPDTGSVTLRASFPNPDRLLLPGMYVRAVVNEGEQANAILAPQRGVTRNAKGQATAMVVSANGKVEPRLLNTSRTVDANWLINDGLQAGDQLIIEGLQKIRPGAPVEAVPAESYAASTATGK